ncbi:MAG: thiamine phosphate synthase [Prevotella sp.]
MITKPEIFTGETDIVNALFFNGLKRLHLRKPQTSETEMAEWIGHISLPFRQRIVVHDNFNLLRTMGLGGIHLNARHPDAPAWFTEEKESRACVTISRSCHTLDEVARWSETCDYIFLSPIFDSISKCGYHSGFTRESLEKAHKDGLFKKPTYALGGVSADNIQTIYGLGFAGAAVIGSLWQVEPTTVDNIIGSLKVLQGI